MFSLKKFLSISFPGLYSKADVLIEYFHLELSIFRSRLTCFDFPRLFALQRLKSTFVLNENQVFLGCKRDALT